MTGVCLLQVTLISTCVRICSQLGVITCSRLTYSSSRTLLALRYPYSLPAIHCALTFFLIRHFQSSLLCYSFIYCYVIMHVCKKLSVEKQLTDKMILLFDMKRSFLKKRCHKIIGSGFRFSPYSPQWAEGICRGGDGTKLTKCKPWHNLNLGTWKFNKIIHEDLKVKVDGEMTNAVNSWDFILQQTAEDQNLRCVCSAWVIGTESTV